MSDLVRRCARLTVEIPRFPYMASAMLPAAGVYTAPLTGSPLYLLPFFGIREITAWCTYARSAGVVNGQAAFRILFGDTATAFNTVSTGELGRDIDIDQTLAVTQPEDNQNFYQQTLYGPIPQSDAVIVFCLPILIPRGTNVIQITAAENGTPANPGSLGIVIAGGS